MKRQHTLTRGCKQLLFTLSLGALLSACVGGNSSNSNTDIPFGGVEAGGTDIEGGTEMMSAPKSCAEIDRAAEGEQPQTEGESFSLSGTYRVSGRWILDQGQRVTIEPGTIFIVESEAELFVGWRGDAASVFFNGTEEQPILFCGAEGRPGFWRGLELLTGTREESYLEHVRIEDAGREETAGLFSSNNVRLNHVSVLNSAAVGFKLEGLGDGSSDLTSKNNALPLALKGEEAVDLLPLGDYTENEEDIIELRGIENTNITFKDVGIPYRQLDERVVLGLAGGDLTSFTFEAGVEYQFCQDCFINVGWRNDPGAIYVRGTEDNPVVFTSSRETPQAGDWNGIWLLSGTTSDSEINFARFEYGGKPEEAALLIDRGQGTIRNSHFSDSLGAGIIIDTDGLLTVENNTFERCAGGDVSDLRP